MSRAPLPYNPKILELFKNPKNLGKMEDASISAVAGNPMCGDMITFYLKISDTGVIEKASFESYGCAANIATSSIVTEMVKGMKLEDAWKVSYKSVAEAVGGLPTVKFHCGILAVGALEESVKEVLREDRGFPQLVAERTELRGETGFGRGTTCKDA